MAKEIPDRLVALEEATEQGHFGEKPSGIPNSAFTLQGQGEDTARLEREARGTLRAEQYAASGEGDASKSSPSKSTKSSQSSSGGSGAGS